MPVPMTERIAGRVSLDREERPSTACENCAQPGVVSFYRVKGIPAHSVLLMESEEEAKGYPRRDLDLAFCPSCGFVGNVAYDPGVHEYSTKYEETQGFSPTFSGFAADLARRVVEEYGLQGKSVLEIGCGKGEFLVQLLEAGAGSGIGIDPAYRHDRLDTPLLEKLEFHQELYTEKHTHLKADMVCCRHTLEHIHPTLEFMKMVRSAIGDQDSVVFFEVPDIVRELRDGAFWDMYYEHTSYFAPGSLSRVFRLAGFDVERAWLEYADQYLMLIAKPADGPTEARLPEEDDLEELDRLCRGFESKCGEVMSRWSGYLGDAHAAGRKVVLWGAGSKAVSFLTTMGITDEVAAAVDINPFKHGKYLPGSGHRCCSPEELAEIRPDAVIVMNPVYVKEITDQLAGMGLHPEVLALD